MREAERRAKRVANALTRLGIRPGDRVATLAWNGYRHFELYFGISGIGAVCHTINPRLFHEQIEYIVNHAEDRVLFVDLTFVPLVEKLAEKLKPIRHIVIMTDAAHMPPTSLPDALCYETLLAAETDALAWPEFDETARLLDVLHLGHDRQPEGGAVLAPLDHPAHLRGVLGRRDRLLVRRYHLPDRADVPRQRLGRALRGDDGRREARLPRRRRSTGRACASCSRPRASA